MASELTSKTLKNVHAFMHDWYNVDLTNEQIEQLGRQNSSLWADLKAGNFDTVCRDQMADEVVRTVLGSGHHWPRNGEGSAAFEKFIEQFRTAARSKGIRTV